MTGDCVPWPGKHRKTDGRPILGRQYAYRVLWEEAHGPLNGLSLHHRCENKWCVNLAHLEPMKQGDHLREHGLPGDWGQADKTHCPQGHEYTEENTYHWRGERHCRTCRTAAKRRYNAKKVKR
jgi:hypothetical protein